MTSHRRRAFEEEKLADVKAMLKDFIQSQMWYFSKGLEAMSKAYRAVDAISEAEDMQELDLLQRAYKVAEEAARSPSSTKASEALLSLTAGRDELVGQRHSNRNMGGRHHAHRKKDGSSSSSRHHVDPDGGGSEEESRSDSEDDVRRDSRDSGSGDDGSNH